jgi:hypothetical protein
MLGSKEKLKKMASPIAGVEVAFQITQLTFKATMFIT